MSKKQKTPWPTKKVMDQVYDLNLWGGKEHNFYSGSGSHDSNIINPYLKVVIDFLNSHKKPLVVCDLGCGDFNIGQHLVKHTKNYFAVDIVEKLIDRNKKTFKENNLEFCCLDISEDKFPAGDCVIIRQVLQHLSNAEILKIIEKLASYKYLILTEHLPNGDFIPNKDIISGQGIRIKHNSGVDLLKKPFNLKIKAEKKLNEHVLEGNKGRITTVLYQLF